MRDCGSPTVGEIIERALAAGIIEPADAAELQMLGLNDGQQVIDYLSSKILEDYDAADPIAILQAAGIITGEA